MDPRLSQQDGVTVFAPGLRKVDVLNSESFLAPLSTLAPTERLIVLDLSDLQFIDSSGLGRILGALRSIRERGGQLRICGVQPAVMVLFSMVRLGEIIGIDPDRETAARVLREGSTPTRGS